MSATIKIEIDEEGRKLIASAQTMPERVPAAIAAAMDRENLFTVSHIQQAYLSFPKDGPSVAIGLRVQTNRLRSSLRASKAVVEGETVESAIGSNVAYAAAHEFGATIPAHTIYPKNAAVLRFIIGGKVIFAKKVEIGERVLPARAPIQRGIADRAANYTESISAALVTAWKN